MNLVGNVAFHPKRKRALFTTNDYGGCFASVRRNFTQPHPMRTVAIRGRQTLDSNR